ncbi:MAG: hypothetical protein AVDCRST_MAG25-3593, partial [uncultured Rubrobacteraceae bacterium]
VRSRPEIAPFPLFLPSPPGYWTPSRVCNPEAARGLCVSAEYQWGRTGGAEHVDAGRGAALHLGHGQKGPEGREFPV